MGTREQKWGVALVAFLALLVIFLVVSVWRERDRGTAEVVAVPVPPPPEFLRIGRPGKDLEAFWLFDRRFETSVKAFAIERWDDPRGTWVRVATVMPAARRAVDTTPKKDGERCIYRIVMETVEGRTLVSEALEATWQGGVIPAAPAGLAGKWSLIQGQPHVELSWQPGEARAWTIAVDDELVCFDPPVREPRFVVRVANDVAREVRFSVAALGAFGQEGPRSEIRLACPSAYVTAPIHVSATYGDGVVVVEWQHPGNVRGFRVFAQGFLVADGIASERCRWEDVLLSPGVPVVYGVEAVSMEGVASARMEAPALTVDAQRVPRPAPSDVRAEWVRRGDALQIRFQWVASGGCDIEVDRAGVFTRWRQDVHERDVTLDPPDGLRAYRFRVREWGGVAREVGVPAPGDLLPPAQIVELRREAGNCVHLLWEYPAIPLVKAFRIYRNGVKVIEVDGTIRGWITPPIQERGFQRFQVEALGPAGVVSPRGGEQAVYLPE